MIICQANVGNKRMLWYVKLDEVIIRRIYEPNQRIVFPEDKNQCRTKDCPAFFGI